MKRQPGFAMMMAGMLAMLAAFRMADYSVTLLSSYGIFPDTTRGAIDAFFYNRIGYQSLQLAATVVGPLGLVLFCCGFCYWLKRVEDSTRQAGSAMLDVDDRHE
jgi:hypothetical protein